jgi:hypothetical protein
MLKSKTGKEKRKSPRVAIKIPVIYRLEENILSPVPAEKWRQAQQNAYTLDMSLEGMSLAVDLPLEVGSVIPLNVFLLDKIRLVKAYAQVKWFKSRCAGLRFLLMGEEEREALKCFLADAGRS